MATAKPAAKAAAKPAAGRILIVEDDSDILEVLKLMLEYEGHKVVTAKRGAAALAAAREKAFDVAVLDISMPDMSGIEVAQALRGDPRTAGVRIAIHTGVEERWVRERFPDYDHYFAKARDVDVLVAGIARLLATPRASAASRPAANGAPTAASAAPAAAATPAATPATPPAATVPEAATWGDDDLARARATLREALGAGPRRMALPALVEELRDEIGRLRDGGRDDRAIAALLGEALGGPVDPGLLASRAPSGR